MAKTYAFYFGPYFYKDNMKEITKRHIFLRDNMARKSKDNKAKSQLSDVYYSNFLENYDQSMLLDYNFP